MPSLYNAPARAAPMPLTVQSGTRCSPTPYLARVKGTLHRPEFILSPFPDCSDAVTDLSGSVNIHESLPDGKVDVAIFDKSKEAVSCLGLISKWIVSIKHLGCIGMSMPVFHHPWPATAD